jgi:hypothetical protein
MFEKVIYMELQFNYNNMIIPQEMKPLEEKKKEHLNPSTNSAY